MKKTALKENSSVFFIGRGFIIIIVLIVSSLSFTLGYFVGKSTRRSVEGQAFFIPTQQDYTEKKNTENEEKEAVIQQIGETQKPQQTLETQQSQETPKTQETQNTQEITKPKEPEKDIQIQKIQKTTTYTVQAGAFKHVSEANSLKAKLDKKGYKTYVIPSKTKRHQKLYKVMIGEFVTRKEADVLSAKIREAEGLKTFVTIKTGQEDLR